VNATRIESDSLRSKRISEQHRARGSVRVRVLSGLVGQQAESALFLAAWMQWRIACLGAKVELERTNTCQVISLTQQRIASQDFELLRAAKNVQMNVLMNVVRSWFALMANLRFLWRYFILGADRQHQHETTFSDSMRLQLATHTLVTDIAGMPTVAHPLEQQICDVASQRQCVLASNRQVCRSAVDLVAEAREYAVQLRVFLFWQISWCTTQESCEREMFVRRFLHSEHRSSFCMAAFFTVLTRCQSARILRTTWASWSQKVRELSIIAKSLACFADAHYSSLRRFCLASWHSVVHDIVKLREVENSRGPFMTFYRLQVVFCALRNWINQVSKVRGMWAVVINTSIHHASFRSDADYLRGCYRGRCYSRQLAQNLVTIAAFCTWELYVLEQQRAHLIHRSEQQHDALRVRDALRAQQIASLMVSRSVVETTVAMFYGWSAAVHFARLLIADSWSAWRSVVNATRIEADSLRSMRISEQHRARGFVRVRVLSGLVVQQAETALFLAAWLQWRIACLGAKAELERTNSCQVISLTQQRIASQDFELLRVAKKVQMNVLLNVVRSWFALMANLRFVWRYFILGAERHHQHETTFPDSMHLQLATNKLVRHMVGMPTVAHPLEQQICDVASQRQCVLASNRQVCRSAVDLDAEARGYAILLRVFLSWQISWCTTQESCERDMLVHKLSHSEHRNSFCLATLLTVLTRCQSARILRTTWVSWSQKVMNTGRHVGLRAEQSVCSAIKLRIMLSWRDISVRSCTRRAFGHVIVRFCIMAVHSKFSARAVLDAWHSLTRWRRLNSCLVEVLARGVCQTSWNQAALEQFAYSRVACCIAIRFGVKRRLSILLFAWRNCSAASLGEIRASRALEEGTRQFVDDNLAFARQFVLSHHMFLCTVVLRHAFHAWKQQVLHAERFTQNSLASSGHLDIVSYPTSTGPSSTTTCTHQLQMVAQHHRTRCRHLVFRVVSGWKLILEVGILCSHRRPASHEVGCLAKSHIHDEQKLEASAHAALAKIAASVHQNVPDRRSGHVGAVVDSRVSPCRPQTMRLAQASLPAACADTPVCRKPCWSDETWLLAAGTTRVADAPAVDQQRKWYQTAASVVPSAWPSPHGSKFCKFPEFAMTEAVAEPLQLSTPYHRMIADLGG